ncbi:tRNA adenosine(34) deaminase TadA [Culicoidibacter larvae]|uniref:tRNA-specific adenosine deaminase n=1 Tax=Culicoidibacter larvae TaxID=2579976 RepID=A0A5R8QGM3_9FIRM|nr:tRNA adenosine(34) deaminase TadA [Culicoidibacter larvae]TLG77189.1 nucleoside deaminase [Culicoidibacter larvae]
MDLEKRDIDFMREAIRLAKKAESLGEVPIGAIIVHDNKVIARAYNTREKSQNALDHAEIKVIKKACEKLGTWRLNECTLYVTLEPCPMCSGAVIQSRVGRLVYGASDPKAGCTGSLMNLPADTRFNHNPEIVTDVLGDECGEMLTTFFRKIREKKKSSN